MSTPSPVLGRWRERQAGGALKGERWVARAYGRAIPLLSTKKGSSPRGGLPFFIFELIQPLNRCRRGAAAGPGG